MDKLTLFGGYHGIVTGIVALLLLAAAAVAFFKTSGSRSEIAAVLPKQQSWCDMFRGWRKALCAWIKGEKPTRSDPPLSVPEKVWTYDNFYLDRFAKELDKA